MTNRRHHSPSEPETPTIKPIPGGRCEARPTGPLAPTAQTLTSEPFALTSEPRLNTHAALVAAPAAAASARWLSHSSTGLAM